GPPQPVAPPPDEGGGEPAGAPDASDAPDSTGALDSTELRRVFGAFPSGVTAVAALVDGVPAGLAASSFTSVSLDPPLVSVCVAHNSTTWPLLRDRARLGVSVLGAHQERACRQLAARGTDRFAGLGWRATPDGAVLIDDASAWFDCTVENHIRAGDHDIVLLRVHELDADHAVAPLVFHTGRFRRLESAQAVTEPSGRLPGKVKEST
ncbi:flavin reductase family protein, partial [Streptomyces sp. 150FB]|uniref:flavin reductase family protein n=1 Tax=Streptomyces sp. 150FB TaxID=1576605 RepID=UPI0032219332